MYLTRHQTTAGPRWALDGNFLPEELTLSALLSMSRQACLDTLQSLSLSEAATGELLAPVDAMQEIWGSGVTYLRSRDARKAESTTADVYQKVYDAERPELFFKSPGWRAVGTDGDVRIRRDATWNVPEPELTLVINSSAEIVGYTCGNDMSSRDIEGENPLYLPQAKTYNGSCAVGPGIQLADVETLRTLGVRMQIHRQGHVAFVGDTAITKMKRTLDELAQYLCRELSFPAGVLLMTGTGIVPSENFTLQLGDQVRIFIGDLILENRVA